MRAAFWAALVVWAVLPQGASAQVAATLDWDAPGCLPAEALEESVEAQLGRTVFGEAPEIVLRMRVEQSESAVEIGLTLSTRGGALLGRRALRSATTDCRSLDEELVIVVSLLVDLPEDDIRLLVPEPATTTETSAEGARTGASFGLALGALGALDVLPGVTGTIVLAGEVSLVPEVTIELAATFTPPVRAAVEAIGATFLDWTLRPGLCAQARVEVLRVGGCARVGVGTLSVESDGLTPDRGVLRPWIDLSLGPRVGVRWEALEVRLTGGVLVPLLRDAFLFGSPAMLLHRAAPAAPFVELSLAYHFGS